MESLWRLGHNVSVVIRTHTHAHTHTHTHTHIHTLAHTCTHTHACARAHTHTHTHTHTCTHMHSHTCAHTCTHMHAHTVSLASHAANSQLKTFTSSSRQTLQCQTGVCLSLALKFDQFSSSFCTDVVPGLDVFWTTLILILTLSLLILPLALVLAGRFINLEVKKSMAKKFHLTSSVIRQCRAIFWLVLSLSICLWLTVAVFVDDYFQRMFCQNGGSGCCSLCVGVFGALFLLLAALVGGVSRVYQCVIIYRITSKC